MILGIPADAQEVVFLRRGGLTWRNTCSNVPPCPCPSRFSPLMGDRRTATLWEGDAWYITRRLCFNRQSGGIDVRHLKFDYAVGKVQYKFVAEDIAALANACRGDLYRVVVKEEQDPQYGYQWRIVSAERIVDWP